MAIQNRRGADADFDSHKMLPGELAVTTDGSRKVYATFAPGDSREVAFKDQIPVIGNVTPAEVQNAVNNYLTENPVQAGATKEQAKQIELNRQNIETNHTEIIKTKDNVAQLSNPNLFINGNFQIWQRGEEFTVAINEDGTYGGYEVTADKWIVGAWGSDVAHVYKNDKGLTFSRETDMSIEVFQQLEEETLKSVIGKPLMMSYGIEDAAGIYQEYTRSIVLDEKIEVEPFTTAQEYFCIELQKGCTLIWAKLEVGELKTPCVPDSKDAIICRLEKQTSPQFIQLSLSNAIELESGVPVPFDRISFIGDTFSVSNGIITVKKDIKYVRVSATLGGSAACGRCWMRIMKNNTSIYDSLIYGDFFSPTGTVICSAKKGDTFHICSNEEVLARGGRVGCYFSVEKIC